MLNKALSLSLHLSHHLNSLCMCRFTRVEQLGCKFKCSRCQKTGESTKQLSLLAPPPILCFHLKRFEHTKMVSCSPLPSCCIPSPSFSLSLCLFSPSACHLSPSSLLYTALAFWSQRFIRTAYLAKNASSIYNFTLTLVPVKLKPQPKRLFLAIKFLAVPFKASLSSILADSKPINLPRR